MTDTIGTKSGTADMPVVVVAAQDRSHFQVTRLNRVTQMCVAEIPWEGFRGNFLQGTFIGVMP